MLLEVIIFTLLVAATALFLQDRCAIPTPISMIVIVLLAKLAGYQPITISDGYFDQIVIVLLPILICVDAMTLRWIQACVSLPVLRRDDKTDLERTTRRYLHVNKRQEA